MNSRSLVGGGRPAVTAPQDPRVDTSDQKEKKSGYKQEVRSVLSQDTESHCPTSPHNMSPLCSVPTPLAGSRFPTEQSTDFDIGDKKRYRSLSLFKKFRTDDCRSPRGGGRPAVTATQDSRVDTSDQGENKIEYKQEVDSVLSQNTESHCITSPLNMSPFCPPLAGSRSPADQTTEYDRGGKKRYRSLSLSKRFRTDDIRLPRVGGGSAVTAPHDSRVNKVGYKLLGIDSGLSENTERHCPTNSDHTPPLCLVPPVLVDSEPSSPRPVTPLCDESHENLMSHSVSTPVQLPTHLRTCNNSLEPLSLPSPRLV